MNPHALLYYLNILVMGSQKLTQTQKLTQKLSPQQILLIKLLEIPTMKLETRITDEIESNPTLEAGESPENDDDFYNDDTHNDDENSQDDDIDINEEEQNDNEQYDSIDDIDDFMKDDDDDEASYKYDANNSSPDDKVYEAPISNETSFQDSLIEQLGFRQLDEKKYRIGTYIIGNLDDSGYLSRPLSGIADDLLFNMNIDASEDEIRDVLKVIQDFDPAGVGATDLQECLLIQLQRIMEDDPDDNCLNAITIIKNYFEEFTKKHYDKIESRTGLSSQEFRDALNLILSLNPKPGGYSSSLSSNSNYIIPDFTIVNNAGDLELSLNYRNSPDLRVSKYYVNQLKAYEKMKSNKEIKEATAYLKNKIDSAKSFIDALRQRKDTLYVTMKAIMDYQRDFFLTGDETKLKPMILKDIAKIVGLDISTISRVASSKYVQTSFGTFQLKYFFSEALINSDGEEVSTREVKKILKDCIAAEDKSNPLTDEQLTDILKDKGYNIARRTTAKYREQLGIPVARLRKEK